MTKRTPFRTLLIASLFSGSLIFSAPVSAMGFMGNSSQFMDMSINAGYYLLSQNTLSYYDGSRKGSKKKSSKTTKSASKSTTPAKSSAKSTQTTASTPAPNSSYYRFKHSSKVSNQVTDEFIAQFSAMLKQQGRLNAQTQTQLNEIKRMDLIGQVKKALKSDGYDVNNVATAMSAWIVTNYGIATGQNLANLKGHELVKQLEQTMGSEDSTLIGKSDADKQTIADSLYWMTIVMIMTETEAKNTGNTALLKEAQHQALNALSQWGLSTSMLSSTGGRVKLAS